MNQSRGDAKANGKGFLGQWGAQLDATSNYHEVYLHMPPDAALAESPGNFAIDRGTIKKVKYKTRDGPRRDGARSGHDQDHVGEVQAAGDLFSLGREGGVPVGGHLLAQRRRAVFEILGGTQVTDVGFAGVRLRSVS